MCPPPQKKSNNKLVSWWVICAFSLLSEQKLSPGAALSSMTWTISTWRRYPPILSPFLPIARQLKPEKNAATRQKQISTTLLQEDADGVGWAGLGCGGGVLEFGLRPDPGDYPRESICIDPACLSCVSLSPFCVCVCLCVCIGYTCNSLNPTKRPKPTSWWHNSRLWWFFFSIVSFFPDEKKPTTRCSLIHY